MNQKSYGEDARKTINQQNAAIAKLRQDNHLLREQLNTDIHVSARFGTHPLL